MEFWSSPLVPFLFGAALGGWVGFAIGVDLVRQQQREGARRKDPEP